MSTRCSSVLLALLTAGCAWNAVPVVAPIPVHQIPVGINDGYHGFSTEMFQADCPAMIRTPQTSGSALRALLDAAGNQCPVLALVEAPNVALVTAFAAEHPAAIELGNELELPPYELTPSQYGAWIDQAVKALNVADYPGMIVLGGVYALTTETKAAIRWGIMACAARDRTCVIGVHLYDASDEDLAWLRSLNWPVWVTEVGFPTRCHPARVQEQHDYLASQIARFSTVPRLERVFLYQRLDGPTCSDLDTFGIAKKPAARLLH